MRDGCRDVGLEVKASEEEKCEAASGERVRGFGTDCCVCGGWGSVCVGGVV